MSKNVLGRGLSSLLGDDSMTELGGNLVKSIPIESIEVNPYQPRKYFDQDELKELARSIETSGLLQPIVVRFQRGKEGYTLVSGERRLRAVKLLGWEFIPAMIREIEEKEMALLAVVENVQRKDISPIEEAHIYKRIMEDFSLTQDSVANLVGKSRSHIANVMRLLSLPEEVKAHIKTGDLGLGQAKELMSKGLDDEEKKRLAKEIVEKRLTVKDISEEIKQKKNVPRGTFDKDSQKELFHVEQSQAKDLFTQKIEQELQIILKTKVKIDHNQKKKQGRMVLEYYSLEELDRLVGILKKGRESYEGSGFSLN